MQGLVPVRKIAGYVVCGRFAVRDVAPLFWWSLRFLKRKFKGEINRQGIKVIPLVDKTEN